MSIFSKISTQLARWQHGKAIAKLKLIGVTGSCGKTTTAHIIGHILQSSSCQTGILSTTGLWLNDQLLDGEFCVDSATSVQIYRVLATLEKSQVTHVVVETPPRALKHGTFSGLTFDSVVLTNIAGGELATESGDVENYAETIFSPITQIVEEGLVVLNGDDDSVTWLEERAEALPQRVFAAWCRKEDTREWHQSLLGMNFQFEGVFLESSLLTKFNLENLLEAIKVCSKYTGLDSVDIAVKSFQALPGRMQLIKSKGRQVFIDASFAPVVVKRVLQEVRELIGFDRKMVCVTGLSGRVGEKYAHLGASCVEWADVVYFAASDPTGREVVVLNNLLTEAAEKLKGVVVERIASHEEYKILEKKNLELKIARVLENGDVPIVAFDANTPSSRNDALEFAIQTAGEDDVIVVLGKGDDDVIDFGSVVYEWSDIDTVRTILQEL